MDVSWSDVALAVALGGGWLLIGLLVSAAVCREEPRDEPPATIGGPPPLVAARPVLVLSPRPPFHARYDRDRDVFSLSLAPDQPAASYQRVGAVWVRAVPTTGEVVGIEIEEFLSRFLPAHPALQQRWQRPALRTRLAPVRWWARQRFLRALLAELRQRLDAAPDPALLPQDAASP